MGDSRKESVGKSAVLGVCGRVLLPDQRYPCSLRPQIPLRRAELSGQVEEQRVVVRDLRCAKRGHWYNLSFPSCLQNKSRRGGTCQKAFEKSVCQVRGVSAEDEHRFLLREISLCCRLPHLGVVGPASVAGGAVQPRRHLWRHSELQSLLRTLPSIASIASVLRIGRIPIACEYVIHLADVQPQH